MTWLRLGVPTGPFLPSVVQTRSITRRMNVSL